MRYFTTPIFYPNDKPHIGHAYTIVITDILARLGKLCGDQTYMSTGLDEHGQKVAKAAATSNLTPQEHVDAMSCHFTKLCNQLTAQPDIFIRTTSDQHQKVALDIWQQLEKAGMLYEGKYAGWYLPSEEAFCIEKAEGAVWLEETCVFFALSKLQDQLLELYEQNPDLISPQTARNEIINLIKGGLKDLCVTRKNTWGISIPNTEYTMYVWIDALTNYISAAPGPMYIQNAVHIMAKDILRFHAIYWPAILMSVNLPMPKKIISHGWWIQGGAKMSKSQGNVVDPIIWLQDFGSDGVRYFFARIKKLETDCEINYDEIVKLYNTELLGGVGNLGQRLMSMIYRLGSLPESTTDLIPNLQSDALLAYNEHDPHKYANAIYDAVVQLNKYLSDTEPWKSPNQANILADAFNGWKKLVFWMQPLLPAACAKWTKQIEQVFLEKTTGVICQLPRTVEVPK